MKRRRIKDVKEVRFVSLVPRGANTMPVLYKQDDMVSFQPLCKFDEERGELLAVVYAPELRDSQGDVADADVVRKMAHLFARDGMGLDIKHDGKPLDREQAYVAENFIVQKGDPRFADFTDYQGQQVDVTGAWAVLVKIDDEDLRKSYREGDWNGVSLEGRAEVEVEKIEQTPPGDDTMKAEEIAKMLEDTLEKRDAALLAEVKKMLPEQEETPPAPPADSPFSIDPLNKEAVQEHLTKLERERVRAEVDWNDPVQVRKHLESLTKSDENEEPEDEGYAPSTFNGRDEGLTKADQEIEFGASLAKIANEGL